MLPNRASAKIRIHGQVTVHLLNCITNLAPQSKEIQMGFIVTALLGGAFLAVVVLVFSFGAGMAVVAEFFKALCGSDDD